MNQAQAETAITGAALVVGGVYVYRKLTEGDGPPPTPGRDTVKRFTGAGPVLPVGPFVIGWGFTFLVLSLMAQVDAGLGGNFAILVAAGAVLGNGEAVFQDLDKQLGGSSTKNAGAVDSHAQQTAPAPTSPGRTTTPGFPIAPTTTH